MSIHVRNLLIRASCDRTSSLFCSTNIYSLRKMKIRFLICNRTTTYYLMSYWYMLQYMIDHSLRAIWNLTWRAVTLMKSLIFGYCTLVVLCSKNISLHRLLSTRLICFIIDLLPMQLVTMQSRSFLSFICVVSTWILIFWFKNSTDLKYSRFWLRITNSCSTS